MSIIPVICHNYLEKSRRLRDEDVNSRKNINNGVLSSSFCLNTDGFSSIAEYRKAYHEIQKSIEESDKNKRGGIRL